MPLRVLFCLVALLALAVPAHAETIGGNPGPEHNYVCPHADGGPALECFFDAVAHLYTMCRNVKAIEIIEFGYEKSTEGTNGAKSESCFAKQKQALAKAYQAAVKEAKKSKKSVADGLHHLHEFWLTAMTELNWRGGESDDDYKSRVAKPYDEFKDRIAGIRTAAVAPDKAAEPAAKKQSAKAAHAKAKTN
jgi:hypothetical protein